MDKTVIARNFSRYAYLYDRYADIQREASLRLLDCIKKGDCSRILEIGCGTGNFTLKLRDKFRGAQIKAIDISAKMVEIAKKKLEGSDVEFIISDAEEIALPEKFDLVISHACFQWIMNLEKALVRSNELLKDKGRIVFSAFGPLTFRELSETLESILKNAYIQAGFFLNKDNLESALNRHFKGTQIQEVSYEEYFLNLKDLLHKIKYSGIRGSGIGNRIQIGRRILEKLEKEYLNRFTRIKATYQVFFCQGQKI